MKEKHNEKMQLVALKLADEGMQINQDYISSIRTGKNFYGQISLYINLNQNGAKHFEEVTKKNIGKHLAIMLDNVVQNAPVIISTIHSGGINIDLLSKEELAIYSNILSAGRSYPAKLNRIVLKP